eukprot:1548533-Rhodomonas_salina.1
MDLVADTVDAAVIGAPEHERERVIQARVGSDAAVEGREARGREQVAVGEVGRVRVRWEEALSREEVHEPPVEARGHERCTLAGELLHAPVVVVRELLACLLVYPSRCDQHSHLVGLRVCAVPVHALQQIARARHHDRRKLMAVSSREDPFLPQEGRELGEARPIQPQRYPPIARDVHVVG